MTTAGHFCFTDRHHVERETETEAKAMTPKTPMHGLQVQREIFLPSKIEAMTLLSSERSSKTPLRRASTAAAQLNDTD